MAKAVITDKNQVITGSIKKSKYSNTVIKDTLGFSTINEVLPFRVRFTNIMIPAYSPSNVAPIGIAIIGFNNYIL